MFEFMKLNSGIFSVIKPDRFKTYICMKLNYLFIIPAVVLSAACGDEDHTVPDYGQGKPTPPVENPEPDQVYPWEEARTEMLDFADMVLIYGGGRQRYIPNWDADRLQSYVTYTDESGKETWFFDAYLWLEFADYGAGSNLVTYATGYKDPVTQKYLDSATKADWERLINYYFLNNHNLAQLDRVTAAAAVRLGQPVRKPRVVISIPEPIVHANCMNSTSRTDYWGELDGRKLDFADNADRLDAVIWYIDRCRAMFNDRGFKNIELAGFYWICEHSRDTSTILDNVSQYLHKLNYSFNWIPYYSAQGYADWKKWGFDYAFLQPNYFFNDATPLSRLDDACNLGIRAGMSMEMEFDDNVFASRGDACRAYKLRNYMDAFRRYGVWADKRIAYYQGNNTVHSIKVSQNADDRALFHEFAKFVTTRPYRDKVR